jgi:hypothetical protein
MHKGESMNIMTSNKEGLLAKQREELLNGLKARFEKNMSRHAGLDWADVQARLVARPEKVWSLYEMERTGGEPDWLVMISKRANTFSMIVPPKARKGAAAFVTTAQRWRPGKKTNPKIALLIWLRPWGLSS